MLDHGDPSFEVSNLDSVIPSAVAKPDRAVTVTPSLWQMLDVCQAIL